MDAMEGTVDTALLLGCGLVLVAVLAVRLSSRTGVPALLVYLGIGLAVGEEGFGVRFDDYALTADLGLLALAVILAEGGLTTRWVAVRPVLPVAVALRGAEPAHGAMTSGTATASAAINESVT